MRESIRRYDPRAEFPIREDCFINELSNTEDDPVVSIARARVPAGVTTRWHRVKNTVERYVMLEGKGRVEVGTRTPEDVGPGDVVLIPSAAPQRISNTGEDDLIFLAICTPRFVPEAYEDIS